MLSSKTFISAEWIINEIILKYTKESKMELRYMKVFKLYLILTTLHFPIKNK